MENHYLLVLLEATKKTKMGQENGVKEQNKPEVYIYQMKNKHNYVYNV